MRPAGEVREALRAAARDLVASLPPDRGVSLQELAAGAKVGADAALHTVRNMARGDDLTIVAWRRVEHRNRPVAEYRPVDPATVTTGDGFVDLGTALTFWAR